MSAPGRPKRESLGAQHEGRQAGPAGRSKGASFEHHREGRQLNPLPQPPRTALVIALRYLGDVLLATPVANTVKRLYPDCRVDMLVFRGSESILEGNADLNAVITTRDGASAGERLAQMRRLWRRYDLAVVTSTGTPPALFGFAAARYRVGLADSTRWSRRWKRALLARWTEFEPGAPRTAHNDRLAVLLGAPRAGDIVPPTAALRPEDWLPRLGFDPQAARFAVVHPSPRWRYKRWTAEGWRALVAALKERTDRVLITGAPDAAEKGYLDQLALDGERVLRVDGRLRLAEAADLLKRAALYVGPDTAMTHLAAACGTPTVALFGPTDPVIWGPTSNGGERRPYQRVAPLQRRDNVALLQNPDLPCVPCQGEGCERHRESRSDCLDRLPASRVIEAAAMLLAESRADTVPAAPR
jgi:heptosyltransferase-3